MQIIQISHGIPWLRIQCKVYKVCNDRDLRYTVLSVGLFEKLVIFEVITLIS